MAFPSLIKPPMWALSPGLVAPEWGDFWKHMHLASLFWEGSGLPAAFDGGGHIEFGGLVNQADWQVTTTGTGINCDASNDYVTFSSNFFPDGEGTVFVVFIPTLGLPQILAYESDGTTTNAYNGFGNATAIREIHLACRGAGGDLGDFTYQDGAAPSDQVLITESSSTLITEVVNTMAGTWKDGGTHRLYVNGIERGSATSKSPYDKITPTVIRWGAPGDLAVNREFNGQILAHYSLKKQLPGIVIQALHRDPFGPFRMADEVPEVISPVAPVVSTDSLIPILKRRRR